MGRRRINSIGRYAAFRMFQQGPKNFLVAEEVGKGCGIAFGVRMLSQQDALAQVEKLNETHDLPKVEP